MSQRISVHIDGRVVHCTKIERTAFTQEHIECISNLIYDQKKLIFKDKRWMSKLLGAGEEKAVYCVVDHNACIFALELIDENHYLNGRLIDGEYFGNIRAKNLGSTKFNPDSVIGLTFSGLVKPREYVHGYEWGSFAFNAQKPTPCIDLILTSYLQSRFITRFRFFAAHYKDCHERNVMFEIASPNEKGVRVYIKDNDHALKPVSIKLRGIDLR